MIKLPTKLEALSGVTRWMNRIRREVATNTLKNGPGYRVTQIQGVGTYLAIDAVGGGSGGKYDFILCRNGEQIRVKLASNVDPTTVEPDTGEEDPPAP